MRAFEKQEEERRAGGVLGLERIVGATPLLLLLGMDSLPQ